MTAPETLGRGAGRPEAAGGGGEVLETLGRGAGRSEALVGGGEAPETLGRGAGRPDATGGGGDAPEIAEMLGRCAFPDPPGAVDCGLSGGPDSSALVALAAAAGLEVTAWHVDHGLRPDSGRDAAAARAVADRIGCRFELRTVAVEAGPNLEARARAARYAALPDDVCMGHTADDRAETVLFNIGRGGGLAGAGAPYRAVRRPLLALRRHETSALCARLGLPVVSDPMNDDLAFARVAIRHEVLPALARALGRDPVPLLNRHADLCADAHEVIAGLAAGLDPASAAELAEAPRAVASEALRAWVAAETGSAQAVSARSIERILAVAAGRRTATEIEGGHRVARTRRRLRVEAPARHRGEPR